jgi:hypothetical protein
MKREFNTIITDRKISRYFSKDNSYNTGKNKKFFSKYSNNLDRKPLNYFLSSFKYTNLKDNNEDNNIKMTKREYSFKNPKVNNTLNDIYDTIIKINHLNRKIQKILYNPHRNYNLSHTYTNYNKQNIILFEKYKQIKLNNLNDLFDNDSDNYNNKYKNGCNNDYLRKKVKSMNYNDESSKENNINEFFINLKLNGNNNRNKQFNRNNTNYNFYKYFKINDDEKIDDKYIYKIKEKTHTNEHKIYHYRNTKNIFRNRKRYNSLNTDLNKKKKEKIIDNLKNIKYKKFNISENKNPFNNSRFSDEKKI